ncbi:hypothetical protein VCHA57P527_90054 [Vibrio chagasii]|nr:hypothetical protein VCHA57P527_90054 [Vibrio chagasii]
MSQPRNTGPYRQHASRFPFIDELLLVEQAWKAQFPSNPVTAVPSVIHQLDIKKPLHAFT